MTSTLKSKPQYKTISVTKDNGSVVQVCRCKLANLETLMEVQERLLVAYVQADGAMAKLFTNPELVADLELACSLLPITGKEDTSLDYSEICENWEQTVLLLLNGGLDVDTREIGTVRPSKVSQLHFLPYMETVRKTILSMKEEAEKLEG